MSIGLPTPRITVEVEEYENAIVLRFGGELDLATRPEVEHAIEQAHARTPRHLIFDLRSLEFIDSTGLQLLVRTHLHSRRDGRGSVHVACGKDQIRHVVEMMGLDKLISVIEDPAEVTRPPRGA